MHRHCWLSFGKPSIKIRIAMNSQAEHSQNIEKQPRRNFRINQAPTMTDRFWKFRRVRNISNDSPNSVADWSEFLFSINNESAFVFTAPQTAVQCVAKKKLTDPILRTDQ